MTVRYDKLWILLIKNKMKKGELAKAAHLSSHTMTQLNNNRLVSMSVMSDCVRYSIVILGMSWKWWRIADSLLANLEGQRRMKLCRSLIT